MHRLIASLTDLIPRARPNVSILLSPPTSHHPRYLHGPAFATVSTEGISSGGSIRTAVQRAREEAVRRQLEGCSLAAGIWCNGLTVRQLQGLRGALPASAELVVAKKGPTAKALESTPWAALRPCVQGMNAWLFVHTEEIPAALRAVRDFQHDSGMAFNDFAGAVFEGRLYGPDEFAELETMPTRAEFNAYLVASLHAPAVLLVSMLRAHEWGLLPGKEVEGDKAQEK